jgi:hydroxymethylpyrimidine/phosphomethylpyrimidine kinase
MSIRSMHAEKFVPSEHNVRPIVLAIGGSDSSGGAGIQADLRAIEANGGYAATALTAVTAQNTLEVTGWRAMTADWVRAQIEAVRADLPIAAVKSGMLATAEIIGTVAEMIREQGPTTYVCDPLMLSGTGRSLLESNALDVLRRELLPLATVVTPNVAELETLCGAAVRDPGEAAEAAHVLLEAGVRAVAVTGGHLESDRATDLLITSDGCREYSGDWLEPGHDHGSGCVFAAALATQLALGRPLVEAVGLAKRFTSEAIRHGHRVGRGNGPTDPLWRLPRSEAPTASR